MGKQFLDIVYTGKAIEVKKEEEVIELIKSYRRSSYSYMKSSDILNKSKIQTKKSGAVPGTRKLYDKFF